MAEVPAIAGHGAVANAPRASAPADQTGWALAMAAAQPAAGVAAADLPGASAKTTLHKKGEAERQATRQILATDVPPKRGLAGAEPAAEDEVAVGHKHPGTEAGLSPVAAMLLDVQPAVAAASGAPGTVKAAADAKGLSKIPARAEAGVDIGQLAGRQAAAVSAGATAQATAGATALPKAAGAAPGPEAASGMVAKQAAPAAALAPMEAVALQAAPVPAANLLPVAATAQTAVSSAAAKILAGRAASNAITTTGSHAVSGPVTLPGRLMREAGNAQAGPVTAGGTAAAAHGQAAGIVLPEAIPGVHASAPAAAAPPAAAATAMHAAGSVAATPSALAAAITAMHQAGQQTVSLRLDPPGLGMLAVHLGLGQAGQVNVLFVPSSPQTGQLLHAGMDQLRQALAGNGLQLGEAGVGGQGGGQSGTPNGQARLAEVEVQAPAATAVAGQAAGLSAYA